MTKPHTDDVSYGAVLTDQTHVAGDGGAPIAEKTAAHGGASSNGREPWIDALARARDGVGGADLDLPAHESARGFSFGD